MDYNFIKDILDLINQYDHANLNRSLHKNDVEDFKKWIVDSYKEEHIQSFQPDWEGKMTGRSPESVIASHIVHMNRFGKNYFKSAMHGSEFSSQDDVIYLIVLKFSKNMTKIDLIKKNVHEKPAGMQIINRLIAKGWVKQTTSEIDKRSKVINITPLGLGVLDRLLIKVRQATNIVCGDLTAGEKLELIRLLNKLNDFHQPIYDKNIDTENLLGEVLNSMQK
ncbi:MarR family winged helix-turn-helix transcriptional regulator [Chitinophaga barathri]|uniref:MarR family transcriptional regulator n=1 Tax=Chitinophaga barathri TaxID=1647451 RepID=A0A3N4MHS1_9BACT|nr:winged helix DNA-binding protein [Chitinophaga barathri]RPD42975.1 MarR family transcriptional regulator [Chitinophaga barathri]